MELVSGPSIGVKTIELDIWERQRKFFREPSVAFSLSQASIASLPLDYSSSTSTISKHKPVSRPLVIVLNGCLERQQPQPDVVGG